MSAEQQYIDLYQQHGDLLSKNSTPVLNALRDEAFQAFCAQRFPTRKLEKYRYTDISKLFEPDYGLNLRRVLWKSIRMRCLEVACHNLALPLSLW